MDPISADRPVVPSSEPEKCYICGDRFPSGIELDRHLAGQHEADLLPYKCAICGLNRALPIRSMRAINRHFALHDVLERHHECSFCTLRFRTERNLQSHVRLYHRGGTRNVATRTRGSGGEPTPSTHQLQPPAPAQIEQLQCDHCGAIFTTRTALRRHENTHTLRVRYECAECGKQFAKLDCLAQHERIHSQTRPYACDQCASAFIQLAHLRLHKRARHSGERPHRCGICNRGFRCRTALTVHGRIHSGEKPFRCAVCAVPFADAGTLRKHAAVHRPKALVAARGR